MAQEREATTLSHGYFRLCETLAHAPTYCHDHDLCFSSEPGRCSVPLYPPALYKVVVRRLRKQLCSRRCI